MVRKFCPKCRKDSYSSCAEGRWLCPTCGHDLSSAPICVLSSVGTETGDKNLNQLELRQQVKHLSLIYSK